MATAPPVPPGAAEPASAAPAAAADKTHQQMMAEIRMLQEQQAQLQQMLHGLADTLKTMTAKIDAAQVVFVGDETCDRIAQP